MECSSSSLVARIWDAQHFAYGHVVNSGDRRLPMRSPLPTVPNEAMLHHFGSVHLRGISVDEIALKAEIGQVETGKKGAIVLRVNSPRLGARYVPPDVSASRLLGSRRGIEIMLLTNLHKGKAKTVSE